MKKKLRIKQSSVCEMLDITPQTIRDLLKTDPTFPKPMKQSDRRQGALYFDYEEIVNWYESQKQKQRVELDD